MRTSFPFLLVLLVAIAGCEAKEDAQSAGSFEVTLSAAFTDLAYVDVYATDGTYLETVGADTDFSDALPRGTYLMDFVSGSGQHSFLPDGRMAFAPMTQGAAPVGGPVDLFVGEAPLWEVAVDPALEGNARLARRLRDRDPSLEPWRRILEPEDPEISASNGPEAAPMDFNPRHGWNWQRLRVTWEASFAMTGKFTLDRYDLVTCNDDPDCWTARGDTFAYWSADEDNVGYIDYDTEAWDQLLVWYTAGDASCTQDGYEAMYGPCLLSVNTSDARNYTCQSEDGTCVDGTGADATKPRGGQCKFFQNLVLYRSGIYPHSIPSDNQIASYDANEDANEAPVSSPDYVAVGDVLRRLGDLHSQIVVAYNSDTGTALVVDSNYSGYDPENRGHREYIGYRSNGFDPVVYKRPFELLSNYRNLQCVYGVTDVNDRDGDGETTDTWTCILE